VNETTRLCHWRIPATHFLESWSDARAFDGTVTIVQPLIEPLYAGVSAHELLDAFVRQPPRSAYEIVRATWQAGTSEADFEKDWRKVLSDGVTPGVGGGLVHETETANPSRPSFTTNPEPL